MAFVYLVACLLAPKIHLGIRSTWSGMRTEKNKINKQKNVLSF